MHLDRTRQDDCIACSCGLTAGDFVEDDDGMGYVDVGEEDYWGAEDGAAGSGDEDHEAETDAKRQKTGMQEKGECIFQDDSPGRPRAARGQRPEHLS